MEISQLFMVQPNRSERGLQTNEIHSFVTEGRTEAHGARGPTQPIESPGGTETAWLS